MKLLTEEVEKQPQIIDPSELLRPEPNFTEKGLSKFRDYSIDENDPLKEMVRKTYAMMHKNQTVDFVKRKLWLKLSNLK